MISWHGIQPDPAKTEMIKSYPIPLDVTKVGQFLSLVSYYCRFAQGFPNIAAARHNLLKKKVPFYWTSECEVAFHQLKQLLISAPVLAYSQFRPDHEFILETSAIETSLGALLPGGWQCSLTTLPMPPGLSVPMRKRNLVWCGLFNIYARASRCSLRRLFRMPLTAQHCAPIW